MTTIYTAMASADPERLLAIDENTDDHKLTFAAEAMGLIDSDEATTALLRLSRHRSSLVREGAAYGLERHRHRPLVDERLQEMASTDGSPGVRAAAAEALEP